MLIVFEGGEGSGKGTQIKLLKKVLEEKGLDVLDIVEPGGTEVGEAIRDVLLNRNGLEILGITEVYLFSGVRAQQVRTVTRPALKKRTIVLSDRSFFSTYAYQGFARGEPMEMIGALTDFAVGDTTPDLVILLDLPPEVGLARKKNQKKVNRLDSKTLRFHKRVRNAYLKMAEVEPDLWKVVDADAPVEEIHKRVVGIVFTALQIPN